MRIVTRISKDDKIDYSMMKYWTTMEIKKEINIENPFAELYKYLFKSYEDMYNPYDIMLVIEYRDEKPITDDFTCIYELSKLMEKHYPELMI
jgi:hypothetical protein